MRRHLGLIIQTLRRVVGVAVSISFLHAVAASNSIESVDVSPQAGNKTLIRVRMKNDAVKPAGFTVTTPPRIAVDFADVSSNLSNSTVATNQGNLRSVNVVEANGRSRLVISLIQNAPYDIATQGKDVLITVGSSMVATSTAPSGITHLADAKPSNSADGIRDIEFRKGLAGEGRIIIDLSSSNPGIDIRQQGSVLLIDLNKVTLPANLQRRMDVTDFGTPVVSIDAKPVTGGARLVVQPKGTWEYSAYQTDNKLVVEVKEQQLDNNRPIQKAYTGEKLSLNFQNVEVRSVLAVLADFTGLNIITSDTVTGNLTLRLKDVPWDQAFDIVLQAKGLDSRKKGNVILVAPRDELATKEKLALEANQSISELEPTRTEGFQLNYQKAKTVFDFLKDEKNRFLTKRGSVIADERTNQVFVTDVPSKLDEFRELLRKIDIPTRQVLIEARVVVATENFTQDLGGRITQLSGTKGIFGAKDSTAAVTGSSPSTNTSFGGATLGLTLTHVPSNFILGLELSAMELDNRGKVVSSPRVVTLDQQKAVIKQGTQIGYVTCTSTSTTSSSTCTTTFKDADLSLEVTPQITPDGRVSMVMKITKDTVGETINGVPSIDTREVTTQALVNNGETTVIGGIFEVETNNNVTKTPGLGDIPILGWLFKKKEVTSDKRELLIFITPRILDDRLAVR